MALPRGKKKIKSGRILLSEVAEQNSRGIFIVARFEGLPAYLISNTWCTAYSHENPQIINNIMYSA